MKTIKYIFVLLFFANFFIACTPESLPSNQDTYQTGGEDAVFHDTDRDGN